MALPQIVTYLSSGERNLEQRRTKENEGNLHDASIGAAAVGKGTSRDEATLNSEIKPIDLAVIELCLSEGISQIDSQSVSH